MMREECIVWLVLICGFICMHICTRARLKLGKLDGRRTD